jgi:hypothetical protein
MIQSITGDSSVDLSRSLSTFTKGDKLIFEGLNIIEMKYEVNEKDFQAEVCLNDPEKIKKISNIRVMNFGHHKIHFTLHEQKLVDEMRENFKKNKQFDYMKSFNLGNNFEQLVKACSKIIDKPSRINMKFETFDRKFSICFADSTVFEAICKLVHNYYQFFKRNRTTVKFMKKRNQPTSKFSENPSKTTDSLQIDMIESQEEEKYEEIFLGGGEPRM